MRTWGVLQRVISAPKRLMEAVVGGIKGAWCTLCAWCGGHAKLFHKLEHLGNVVLLTSVAAGIREIEATAAGCMVIVVAVIAIAGSTEA